MKVILPSLGHYGIKSVDLSSPTIQSLRAVQSMNLECPDLLKIQFVQHHCSALASNEGLSKITYYDLEYLYQVLVFAASLNTVKHRVTCPSCGKLHERTFSFGSQDLLTLDKFFPKDYHYTIQDQVYSFRVLSALDFQESVLSAIESDLNYDDVLNDAIVAHITSLPGDIPIQLYLYAFLFHRITFHGVRLIDTFTCECSNSISASLTLPPSLISLSSSELFSCYSSVSDQLSFENFLSLSIPEYKAFIDSLS